MSRTFGPPSFTVGVGAAFLLVSELLETGEQAQFVFTSVECGSEEDYSITVGEPSFPFTLVPCSRHNLLFMPHCTN